MKKSMLAIILALAVVGAMWGCDDDDYQSRIPEEGEAFPNLIGSTYSFAYYDSVAEVADTVAVSIVGQRTLDNGEVAKVWVCQFENHADTHFVSQIGQTTKIYWRGLDEPFVLQEPLSVGKYWPGETSDTVTVLDTASVAIPAGTFTKAYRTERTQYMIGATDRDLMVLAPEVGITIMTLKTTYVMPPPNIGLSESWILLDYTIATQPEPH